MLALIYHCGLRVGEAVALKPGHIDAQRGVVRVVEGKGGRIARCPSAAADDRAAAPVLVLSSQRAVALSGRRARLEGSHPFALCGQWRESREAMSVSAVQNALRMALSASGTQEERDMSHPAA